MVDWLVEVLRHINPCGLFNTKHSIFLGPKVFFYSFTLFLYTPGHFLYTYIYIYIYIHPQTLFRCITAFNLARHVGRLKLGSKPTKLYVRISIRPLGQQAHHVSKGIIRYYVATAAAAFVCLHFIPDRIPEYSNRSKSFALCEPQM